MSFLTQDKLTIVGAAGMIGSNMAQTAAMMSLTPNICLYDPFPTGLEGVAEEIRHCGFEGLNLTFTSDIKEALTGAKYIVSSGGAPRKDGMTREDLLKGNAEIAAQLGKDIKAYCPDVRHVVIIFNPADITGLVTLIHSGLRPEQVTTLAALDSLIGSAKLSAETWEDIKQRVTKGGANIIKLRGRSSFQSPAYVSIEMIRAAMGGAPFRWPAGCYVNIPGLDHVVMGMETIIDKDGVHYSHEIKGSEEEKAALKKSYEHLVKMRDEVISMGVIPAVADWKTVNPNL